MKSSCFAKGNLNLSRSFLKSAILYLLLSVFNHSLVSAQNKNEQEYLFFDTFDDNRYEWPQINNRFVRQEIKNGKLMLEYKQEFRNWRFFKSVPINTELDFIIETIITQLEGPDNYGFGLIWGTGDQGNNYNFTIASNGLFRIWGHNSEDFFTWQEWLSNENIRPKGVQNKLKIAKTGEELNFYINDKHVFSHDFEPFHGTLTGFVAGRKSKLSVDYLRVSQEKREINLVESSDALEEKVGLPDGINTNHAELSPIISPDGSRLYFARRTPVDNLYGFKRTNCDIFYADKLNDSTWSKIKKMAPPLNNEGDNLVISVSADGNTLLLEGVYNEKGLYAGDHGISISQKTETGWSVPEQVIIQNFYNQNEYESYGHTADRKVLIMSLQRDDSRGKKDLYVSFQQKDGTYSTPLNMGDDLNTNLDEGTPFIAPDNRTLYFYSYGHAGFGSADIFVSKRMDDTWTHWSTPKNLGPKVNSSEWDTYYSVSARGDVAYLVSIDSVTDKEDIYEIPLNEETRPDPVVLIKGKVKDKETGHPINATIVYQTINNKEATGNAQSDPGTGNYNIILQYGEQYSYHAEAKGYMALNEKIDLSNKEDQQYLEIVQDLELVPLKVGNVIELKNVTFAQNKAVLMESSFEELDRLSSIMHENPDMEIELCGHTETRGNRRQLQVLSEERVEAAKQYLVDTGIRRNRIKGKGFGSSQPLYRNDPDKEKFNRRVELKITKI